MSIHPDDHPTLRSFNINLWTSESNLDNSCSDQEHTYTMRSLEGFSSDLAREYTIVAARNQINEIMKVAVPIQILDVNNLYLTEIDNIDENIKVNISDLQVIKSVTESIGKFIFEFLETGEIKLNM